ncbi:MAG: hypothetical protein P8176_13900 [Gammaproteobacteria bacterium]
MHWIAKSTHHDQCRCTGPKEDKIIPHGYGLDLFYGSNGIPSDKSLGISFVEQAVDNQVEGADEYLKEMKSQLI